MAGKSSNATQSFSIALIIFVLLTFVLAVSNYFAYKWGFDNQKTLEAKQKEASDENSKRLEAENKRLELVKDVLGLSEDMDNPEITKLKKDQIDDLYGKYLDQPTYVKALEWLATSIKDADGKMGALAAEKKQFDDEKKKLAEEKAKELELLKTEKQAAQAQLDELRKTYDEYEKTSTEEKNKLIAEKQQAEEKVTLLKTLGEEIAKGESFISTERRKRWPAAGATDDGKGEDAAEGGRDGRRVTLLLEEMRDKDKTIAFLNQVVAQVRVADPALQKTVRDATPKDDRVDAFDGRVLSVNELDRTVLISVGSTGGIRTGLMFDVYDPVDPQPQLVSRKGVVEVVAIEGDSLVRARVRRDTTRDPILPGDAVATSLWSPGSALEVVLVGVPQFGSDAAVDAERFRRIVERIGGTVETGVTPATTMVVDGGIPKMKGIDPDRQALRKPMTEKEKENRLRQIAEAKRLGIKVVALEPFLDMMGLQLDAVGSNRLPVPADQRAAPARTENVAY